MKSRSLLLIGVLIVVVALVSYFMTLTRAQNSSARDVVVLENGDVYFGYLSNVDSNFVTLRDVYYPQDPKATKNTDTDVKRKISLFQYGKEIYGPESTMYINRSQIVFYSTMRENSKINEAINNFVANEASPSPSPSASPSP